MKTTGLYNLAACPLILLILNRRGWGGKRWSMWTFREQVKSKDMLFYEKLSPQTFLQFYKQVVKYTSYSRVELLFGQTQITKSLILANFTTLRQPYQWDMCCLLIWGTVIEISSREGNICSLILWLCCCCINAGKLDRLGFLTYLNTVSLHSFTTLTNVSSGFKKQLYMNNCIHLFL